MYAGFTPNDVQIDAFQYNIIRMFPNSTLPEVQADDFNKPAVDAAREAAIRVCIYFIRMKIFFVTSFKKI